MATPDALSALPSVRVRIAAFAAICLSGIAGAVIGGSLVRIQCEGDCGLPVGVGLFVGAVVAAVGMAIVAVLVMRAMGEWHEIEDRERAGHGPA
jgi:branched-subunit amino acid ABC-type transport system permease component